MADKPKFEQVESDTEQRYVYRAWITTRDGIRIYAKQYGLRAFRIPVNS